jgi:ribosomal protein S18 acetylase RimI-like enzyme
MVAALPAYRRRGLVSGLINRAFAVCHARGQTEVSTEVDVTNTASNTLMAGLGARRVGGSVELLRPAGPAVR